MSSVSVQQLVDRYGRKLALRWVAGEPESEVRMITLEDEHGSEAVVEGTDDENAEISPAKSLVGHLNLIHPNQVQVIGYSELHYLLDLKPRSLVDSLKQILIHDPACIVVAEGQQVPDVLRDRCEQSGTPLLATTRSSDKLSDSLHYYLSNMLAEFITLHGVFMEVTAIGVLLTGPAGVGKSELALELITRGHRLVADDAPQFSKLAPDIVNGTCPKALADFLEVRGIGIVNVRELFGDSAIKSNKYLRLIIRLEPLEGKDLAMVDRLEESYRTRKVLDNEIPEITLPVAPGRNLAVLVECAARNHILRVSGYNSTEDFAARQAKIIEQQSGSA